MVAETGRATAPPVHRAIAACMSRSARRRSDGLAKVVLCPSTLMLMTPLARAVSSASLRAFNVARSAMLGSVLAGRYGRNAGFPRGGKNPPVYSGMFQVFQAGTQCFTAFCACLRVPIVPGVPSSACAWKNPGAAGVSCGAVYQTAAICRFSRSISACRHSSLACFELALSMEYCTGYHCSPESSNKYSPRSARYCFASFLNLARSA